MSSSTPFLLRCRQCHARNRIPEDRISDPANCGKCGHAIDTSVLSVGTVLMVNDKTFADRVIESPLPVLLMCWAPWCGHCRGMFPILDHLASGWRGRVRVGRLNIDESPGVASRFQVMSVPTLMVFDNGQLKDTLVGAQSESDIERALSMFS